MITIISSLRNQIKNWSYYERRLSKIISRMRCNFDPFDIQQVKLEKYSS